jgi:hypothetical protein
LHITDELQGAIGNPPFKISPPPPTTLHRTSKVVLLFSHTEKKIAGKTQYPKTNSQQKRETNSNNTHTNQRQAYVFLAPLLPGLTIRATDSRELRETDRRDRRDRAQMPES